jgi:hypothetical protein
MPGMTAHILTMVPATDAFIMRRWGNRHPDFIAIA